MFKNNFIVRRDWSAHLGLRTYQVNKKVFYTILCIKCVFSPMCLGYKRNFKLWTIFKRGRMRKKVFTHSWVYNSILRHKGVKKIFCTHRHERVHKNDFKHDFKIDFMHELARSAKNFRPCSLSYLMIQRA